MIRINNIKLNINTGSDKLIKKASGVLGVSPKEIQKLTISKKSIDARDKNNICFVYSVDVEIENEKKYLGKKNVALAENTIYKTPKAIPGKLRPIIAGAGPAGLFAGLILSEAGLKPIIIERGRPVCQREKDVALFWETGRLDTGSNVQFGEGGAGAFSDGKLNTGINDFRIRKVLNEFIALGAPCEIGYLAKPHIGTDKLIGIIKNMRSKIEALGGEYRFNTTLRDFHSNGKLTAVTLENTANGVIEEISCQHLILAVGHSARDTFKMLLEKGVYMEAKAFSVGVRIEHLQENINKAQYGAFWKNKELGAAEYKLSTNIKGRGVYTFCMCPGGKVIAAATEDDYLAINGMSYHSRELENANSALLVSLYPSDFPGKNPLRAIEFQREIEKRAFLLGGGNYYAPVQLTGDFLKGIASKELGVVVPSYSPGYTLSDINQCLPEFVCQGLKGAIIEMGKKIQGFDSYDSIISAVESRSSSPVRIIRGADFNSNIPGLIPCGEGAGYAGGIMSACVDGMKCAEAIIRV